MQSLARLEARLSALVKLREDVQKQGALEPWLAKHELAGLQRLWQKLHVEPGWKPRWNRPCANAWPRWKCAAWTGPAPSPKTRRPRVWPSTNCRSRPRAGSAGLTPLASLLRITDPDLRTLLNEWLAGVYTAPDLAQALSMRATLPAGAACVVKAGHLVDAQRALLRARL